MSSEGAEEERQTNGTVLTAAASGSCVGAHRPVLCVCKDHKGVLGTFLTDKDFPGVEYGPLSFWA